MGECLSNICGSSVPTTKQRSCYRKCISRTLVTFAKDEFICSKYNSLNFTFSECSARFTLLLHFFRSCLVCVCQAAKAALINFYDTLRFELRDNVGVTIATHGWIGSEMTRGKFMLEEGTEMQWKEEREVSSFFVVHFYFNHRL